eukprot:gene7674-8979_t
MSDQSDEENNNNVALDDVLASPQPLDDTKQEDDNTTTQPSQIVVVVVDDNKDVKKKDNNNNNMRNFYIVSISYLLFTLTDGALRLVILFSAFSNGFKPLEIALMFVLYEGLSIITNIVAGMIGSRVGLRVTLFLGLLFQLISIGILMGTQFDWSHVGLIIYIAVAQAISGVAKDFVKVSGKSITKLVTDEDAQSRLFKLVAFLTGAKNALKGVGYFLGSVLINYIDFRYALAVLAGLIFLVVPPAIALDPSLGKTNKKISLKEALNKGRNVNLLSGARLFLFGSRDLWFEIALPIFLRTYFGWSYTFAGGFMAVWIIIYGAVQSWTPQLVLAPLGCSPPTHRTIAPWTAALIGVAFVIALPLHFTLDYSNKTPSMVVVIVGLVLFAFVFAVNSSIHSYLILAYTNKDKVASSVGFYYMANAIYVSLIWSISVFFILVPSCTHPTTFGKRKFMRFVKLFYFILNIHTTFGKRKFMSPTTS